jgi:hypothetical protein
MWLITFNQTSCINKLVTVENMVLDTGSSPAIWLANALKSCPEAEIILLFAMEIDENEGALLESIRY